MKPKTMKRLLALPEEQQEKILKQARERLKAKAGQSDNVSRTIAMLEQSIKDALQAYVFAANVAQTWTEVNNTISDFLNAQWKAGVLAGSSPDDAYSVAVGLGSTMTGQDILDGYMNVTVKVAIGHPAEFIELTFQQQMQTS